MLLDGEIITSWFFFLFFISLTLGGGVALGEALVSVFMCKTRPFNTFPDSSEIEGSNHIYADLVQQSFIKTCCEVAAMVVICSYLSFDFVLAV